MPADLVLYESGLTDSSRWRDFEHRLGDIVISTPSKCGTTWAQMLCALLISGTAELPAPLTMLSPWLDMRLRPLDEVVARLDAQSHRRFIKTHSPLDALPLRDDVTYLVVGRDPRDVAISMHHHRRNLNGELFAPLAPRTREAQSSSDSVHGRVLAWLFSDKAPTEDLATLRGTVWHLRTAWERRNARNIVLLHYADLAHDLSSECSTWPQPCRSTPRICRGTTCCTRPASRPCAHRPTRSFRTRASTCWPTTAASSAAASQASGRTCWTPRRSGATTN